MPGRVRKSDFSFDLPGELIAGRPCARRSGSRLPKAPVRSEFADLVFHGVARLTTAGSSVRGARRARKAAGRAEILVEKLLDDGCALALARAAKPAANYFGNKPRFAETGAPAWRTLRPALGCKKPQAFQTRGFSPVLILDIERTRVS